MKWLVQVMSRKQYVVADEINALNSLGFLWDDIGIIPNSPTITNLPDILGDTNELYFLRGSIKSLRLLDECTSLLSLNENISSNQQKNADIYLANLKKFIFYDSIKFDQQYYSQLGLPLLNSDAAYIPLNQSIEMRFTQDMFVKPSKDLKAFAATVLPFGLSIVEHLGYNPLIANTNNDYLLAATPKVVQHEYRFFVVGGLVVTGSQYVVNGKIQYRELNSSKEHNDAIAVANEFAKLYQPSEIFTLDICCSNGEYFIVEYNCFHCSGLYACDIKKIFLTVNDYCKTHINHTLVFDSLYRCVL